VPFDMTNRKPEIKRCSKIMQTTIKAFIENDRCKVWLFEIINAW
jgi:hypothetical protein